MREIAGDRISEFYVYLGLGSSLGDRIDNITTAAAKLHRLLGNMKLSEIVESAAVSESGEVQPELPSYMNAAVCGSYSGSPLALLDQLEKMETNMGRLPSEKGRYLLRVIDLDILYLLEAGDPRSVSHPLLKVPHLRMFERSFVMEPLKSLGFMPEKDRRQGS